jgi:hypothetical protein
VYSYGLIIFLAFHAESALSKIRYASGLAGVATNGMKEGLSENGAAHWDLVEMNYDV